MLQYEHFLPIILISNIISKMNETMKERLSI